MTRLKRVVYTVCALLMLFALWNQRRLNLAEEDARQLQKELTDVAHSSHTQAASAEDISAGGGLSALNPWLDELHERNEDLIGWLTIPNTVIDYPVVQTVEDKDFYLNHDFDGMSDSHGTLYADVACWIGDGNNLIIYGHHMADGTMFQNLMKYQSAEFCEGNGDVLFHTRESTRHFRPVAVMRISESEAREFPYHTVAELPDSAEYEAFFTRCERYADWMAEERPAYPAMLLTLSTCEYSKQNSRLVVVCACTDVETAPEPRDGDTASAESQTTGADESISPGENTETQQDLSQNSPST